MAKPKKLYEKSTEAYGPHRGEIKHCTVPNQEVAVFLGGRLMVKQNWKILGRRRALELPTIGWRDDIRADDIHALGMKTAPIGDNSETILVPDKKAIDYALHDRGFDDYRYEGYENRLNMLNGKVKEEDKDFTGFFTFKNSTNIFTVKRDGDPPNTINYPGEFRADLLTGNFLIIKCGDSVFNKPDYKAIDNDSNSIFNKISKPIFNAIWDAIGIHLYRNSNFSSPDFNCSFKSGKANRVKRDSREEFRPTEKLCLKIHLFLKMAKKNDPKSEMIWYRVDENDIVDIMGQLNKEYHFRKKGLGDDGKKRKILDLKGARYRGIQQVFVLLTQGKNSSDKWQPYFVLEEAYCDGDKVFPYDQ